MPRDVRVAQAVQDEAQKAGREASVFDARGNLTAFLDELKALPDSGFAGAVIMSQHDAAFNRALVGLVAAEFPFVIVDQTLSDLPADSVSSDNRAGGRLAAGALLAAGHSRRHYRRPCPGRGGRLRGGACSASAPPCHPRPALRRLGTRDSQKHQQAPQREEQAERSRLQL